MARYVTEIWPAPEGHRSGFQSGRVTHKHKIGLSDLLNSDFVKPGVSLYRRGKHAEPLATVLPDGRLDVNGNIYGTPSMAAVAITGKSTNGWWFFLVDKQSGRSLRDVRDDYLESIAADVDEDDSDDDPDDES